MVNGSLTAANLPKQAPGQAGLSGQKAGALLLGLAQS